MQGSTVSAVAFALSKGEPADPRRRLFADELPRTARDHERRLLVAVEPLEPSRRGLDVAASALAAFRRAFEASSDEAATLALVRAMAAADAAVEAENRSSASEERDRRVMIGATAVAVEGGSITVAQLPPSQAVLIQDGLVYGLPTMTSWNTAFEPDDDETSAEPLGAGNGVAPRLYRSSITAGDLILLCDSVLARCLVAGEGDANDGSPTKVRTLDAALGWMEHVAACNDLEEVQAACIAMPSSVDPGEPYAHLTSKRRGPRWLNVSNRARPNPWSAASQPPEDNVAGSLSVVPSPPAAAVVESESETPLPATPALDVHDPKPGGEPSETTGIVEPPRDSPDGEQAVLKLGEPVPAAIVPPLEDARPDADTAPIPSMATGSEPAAPSMVAGPTSSWRSSRRSRPHRLGPRRYLLAALVAVVTICGTAGLWHGRYVARAEQDQQASAALAEADATLALAAQDGASPADLRIAADALDQAERLGIPATRLVDRRASLDSYRDAAEGVVRLGGLARLGSLPAELTGAVSPRLIRANRELYIVAGGFYRLDLENNGLVPVLTPGSEVGDQVVGSLRTGGWAPGGISVTDGQAVYSIDGSDTWSMQPLEVAGLASGSSAPSATLNGFFYLLDPATGEIRKFGGANAASKGEAWLPASEAAALSDAVGMVIDGDIHVLLADGRIATLVDGTISDIRPLDVVPPADDPVAIAGGMDNSALWVLDRADGRPRLIRLDSAGGEPRSFLLSPSTEAGADKALDTVHDFAVDEVGHVVYFLTDTAIWRADLPVFVPVE